MRGIPQFPSRHTTPHASAVQTLTLTLALVSCSSAPERLPPETPVDSATPSPGSTATQNPNKRARKPAPGKTLADTTAAAPGGPRIGVAMFASSFRDPDGPLKYSYAWTGRVVRLFDPTQLNVTPATVNATVRELDASTLERLARLTGDLGLDFLVAGIVEIQGATRARLIAYDVKRKTLTVGRDAEHRTPTVAVEGASNAQLEELAQYWSDLDAGELVRIAVHVRDLHAPEEIDLILERLAALRGVDSARHISTSVDADDVATALFHLFAESPPRTLEVIRWESSVGDARLEQIDGWLYRAVYGDGS